MIAAADDGDKGEPGRGPLRFLFAWRKVMRFIARVDIARLREFSMANHAQHPFQKLFTAFGVERETIARFNVLMTKPAAPPMSVEIDSTNPDQPMLTLLITAGLMVRELTIIRSVKREGAWQLTAKSNAAADLLVERNGGLAGMARQAGEMVDSGWSKLEQMRELLLFVDDPDAATYSFRRYDVAPAKAPDTVREMALA